MEKWKDDLLASKAEVERGESVSMQPVLDRMQAAIDTKRVAKMTVTYYFEASSPEDYKDWEDNGPAFGPAPKTYEDCSALEESRLNDPEINDNIRSFFEYDLSEGRPGHDRFLSNSRDPIISIEVMPEDFSLDFIQPHQRKMK